MAILDRRLTKHFRLSEFVRSQTAVRRGIDNTPPNDVIENLRLLCVKCLEPIRERWGPVYITSGYRCPELNRAIGGSKHSQHMRGEAADIIVPRQDLWQVFKWIFWNVAFDQLIWEFGGEWIHISYTVRHPLRHDVLESRIVSGLLGRHIVVYRRLTIEE